MHALKVEPASTLTLSEPELIRLFVKHSEMISGVGFEDSDADWQREHVKRHLEQSRILCKAWQYTSVQLINGALSNRTGGWFRTGVEGTFKGMVPEGKDVRRFVDEIDEEIRQAVDAMKNAPAFLKERFAWDMHDRIICTHAFKSHNGRTARLLMNHVRRLLGLEVFVISYEKSNEYFARVQEYRRISFMPILRKFVSN